MSVVFYSKAEERANVITHALGVLLSIAALVLLMVFGSMLGDAWFLVSSAIFGSSMIALYSVSTIYHAVTGSNLKKKMRVWDHVAIFLLVAGTYTPFTISLLGGPLGWSLFGIVWGLAILGGLAKLFFFERFERLSTLAYVLLGWVVVIALYDIILKMSGLGLTLLFSGGFFYTFGCLFYVKDQWPFNHAIWHLFVLAGSICHFFAVLSFLG